MCQNTLQALFAFKLKIVSFIFPSEYLFQQCYIWMPLSKITCVLLFHSSHNISFIHRDYRCCVHVLSSYGLIHPLRTTATCVGRFLSGLSSCSSMKIILP